MFTTRIKPKLSVNPLASRNRRAAKEIPLIAWRMPLPMRKACTSACAAPRNPRRRLALVRTPLEKFLRLPRPELRDILVGLERDVGQHLANHRMFDLLNARDVHVLDRVVVVVQLESPAWRFHGRGAHRGKERCPVLDIPLDLLDRRPRP